MDGVMGINKPQNMTSFDVCAKIKRKFMVKVGHTGTLDPMATGVMIVCIGQSTKLVSYLVGQKKTYRATCKLGVLTDTADIWGNVVLTMPIPLLTYEAVDLVLSSLLGVSQQTPPMVSAIKVNGKKLYEYARNQETVEIKSREIEIFDYTIHAINSDEIDFTITVSSGTYIRTICETIGTQLNTCATLSSLHRIASGYVDLSMTSSLKDCCEYDRIAWLDPLLLLKDYKQVCVSDPTDIMHGKKIYCDCIEDKVLMVYDQRPLAMYKKMEQGIYRCERGLW